MLLWYWIKLLVHFLYCVSQERERVLEQGCELASHRAKTQCGEQTRGHEVQESRLRRGFSGAVMVVVVVVAMVMVMVMVVMTVLLFANSGGGRAAR
jgi:Flp pilus assembly protein TadB